MVKDLKKYLLKVKQCPICSSKKSANIGIINSKYSWSHEWRSDESGC